MVSVVDMTSSLMSRLMSDIDVEGGERGIDETYEALRQSS